MRKSIGFVELKSIPVGIQTADEMLKAGNVELLLATPICPGKYVIIIAGQTGPVKAAMSKAELVADFYLIDQYILDNIDERVLPAISGVTQVGQVKSIGSIETISALTAIIAGDIAVKAAKVDIVDLRIARGLGGKGFLIITGEVSSVKSAIKACMNSMGVSGEVTSTSVIASPHKDLVDSILS